MTKISEATETTPIAANDLFPFARTGDDTARVADLYAEINLRLATVTTTSIGAVAVSSTINAQTGTSYQLALADGDGNTLITLTNASPITLTVPTYATAAIPVGRKIDIYQGGAGLVTVAAAVGVTINSKSGSLALSGQYAGASLIKLATDTWWLVGGLA